MSNLYTYRVRDGLGQLTSGRIRAESRDEVVAHLESLDLIPIKVSKWAGPASMWAAITRRRARLEDLILVTRKMATLYRAGLPILRSLEIVADQYSGSSVGSALLAVRDNVERGEALSDAMAHYPEIFSGIFVASIRAAEASGRLDTVLEHLAEAAEQELVTKEEIKKATRYPLIVIVAIGVAIVVLMTFVIPKFVAFYGSFESELPLLTLILIKISHFMSANWFVILPLVFGLPFAGMRVLRHPAVKPTADRLLLRLPVFGNLLTKIYFSRFAHVLGVLVASGTPLLKALQIVGDAIGNAVISSEVGHFAAGLKEGRNISESRHLMPHFPKLVLSLVQVGLESGSLELTLKEISRFFDREVHYTSRRLTGMLEPILIVFIGAMILVLALAIFLPMWNLVSVFK